MDILSIQCALHLLGKPDGGLDGVWGINTASGVTRFQREFGLQATGRVDEDTEKAMRYAICFGMPEADCREEAGSSEWDEIEYFERKEFACTCGRCGGFPVEPGMNMVRGTNEIRKWAKVPITPNSAVRCQEHNDELPGSVPNSWHVRGPSGLCQAVDISVRGKTDQQVEAFAKTLPHYYSSYIMSGGGVHIQFTEN